MRSKWHACKLYFFAMATSAKRSRLTTEDVSSHLEVDNDFGSDRGGSLKLLLNCQLPSNRNILPKLLLRSTYYGSYYFDPSVTYIFWYIYIYIYIYIHTNESVKYL